MNELDWIRAVMHSRLTLMPLRLPGMPVLDTQAEIEAYAQGHALYWLEKLLAVVEAAAEYMKGDPSLIRGQQNGDPFMTCMDCGETFWGGTFIHKPDCGYIALETALSALTSEIVSAGENTASGNAESDHA